MPSPPTDNSVEAWLQYAASLPPLGEQWIDSCRRPGNPVILTDTLGTRLKAKAALTGSIILARRIARLSPEQNIGIMLPTTAGGMLAGMAVTLLGKTLVNLNYTAPVDSILSAMEQAQLKTLYTSSRFLEKLKPRGITAELLQAKVRVVMLEDFRASTSALEKLATLLTCQLLPAAWLKKRFCRPVAPASAAAILFSSGSEGKPKGVMLSHRNIGANVKQVAVVLNAAADDLMLANLPLFHSFGLTAAQFFPLLERIPVVCHPDPTDVAGNAEAIAAHRATLLFGTSSFFRLYAKNPKVSPESLASLRLVIAGAEKLQPEVVAMFREKFGKTILEGYGCTETAPVACVNTPADEGDKAAGRATHKPGTVGRAIPGTGLRVIDPDTLDDLPLNEAGMIAISGPQIMIGYLNDPQKTAQVIMEREGRRWYLTGDKGSLDEDGFLSIQDRYARFAKISGEMVGLGKVEQAIRQALQDPEFEVLAVNLPDPRKGEMIVALCTSPVDEAQLRQGLLDGGLNNLALPAAYLQVEALPRLGSGKSDFAAGKEIARRALAN